MTAPDHGWIGGVQFICFVRLYSGWSSGCKQGLQVARPWPGAREGHVDKRHVLPPRGRVRRTRRLVGARTE